MSALPTRTDISGTPTNAAAKSALTALFDFVAQRLAYGTSGAGTASAVELALARNSLQVPVYNFLHNPNGSIYQRAVAATADDAYMDDRWYALTQTSTITPSQLSNPEDGYRHGLRLTQSQVTAQRMGRAQILEGFDTSALRGKTVTFGGRFRLSSSATLRYAILAWTGAEDTVTSDVVNDWTNATFTTGNFFASTTLSLVATGSTALTANTITTCSVSGAVPSSATNLIVLYWTEATAAQNVTLDAWGLRLVDATQLVDAIQRSYADELELCELRYQKSYEPATAPGTATTAGAAAVPSVAASSYAQAPIPHREMRGTPSLSYWDAAGNASRVSLIAAAGAAQTDNLNFVATSSIAKRGSWIRVVLGATAGSCMYQWVLSSDL